MKRLIRNAVKCNCCGDIIESKFVHDIQECSCKTIAVDGGLEYCKVSGCFGDWEDLCEYEEVPGYYVVAYSFGSRHTFNTTKDIDTLIQIYEGQDEHLEIYDDKHRLIYVSNGLAEYKERFGF